ncbi:UNVERIFIED_ORG: hypothetical protein LHK14_03730 [Roseateles sp. XES5]|nr:glycosyltransferase family 9 protein [Roseateles sp. XES5]
MIKKIGNKTETVLVSILIFSGTENIERLLSNFPEKIDRICHEIDLSATVVIRSNNPSLDLNPIKETLARFSNYSDRISFEIFDEGYNSGFGCGHNSNFRRYPHDYILVLNDDLDFEDLDWMKVAIRRLRDESRLAMIGDVSNPNAVNPFFGNGTFPSRDLYFSMKYAEASILLIRGKTFEEIGMFDETIKWAMGEDSDLSFKAQQAGYYVDWMPIPHEHFRSTSFNSLPSFEKSSILEHNRARLFAKWGNSFDSGRIGKFEVFDVYSDGLGDMFCALLHIRAEYDRLNRASHDHIVVNVANESLARLVLPEHARLTSYRDINALRSQLSNDIASIRSIRALNYALPYNIHSLLAGSLSAPFADEATLIDVRSRLRVATSDRLVEGDYCLLHLEFEREGHHGRGPSRELIEKIIAAIPDMNCKIVLVGKNQTVRAEYFSHCPNPVVDLQGKLSLSELVSAISNARFFIGIDSFPFHVAQVSGVPSVVFFGSVSPLLRVLYPELVWPLLADIDCLGCYHDQLEPGIPFCMKMTDRCTYDISSASILNSISGMLNDKPYNWSPVRTRLDRKLAHFVEYQKFHPSAGRRLYETIIPNQQVSELIYELTDRISRLHTNYSQGAFLEQLQEDNARMRSQLVEGVAKLNAYEEVQPIHSRDPSKVRSVPSAALISGRTRCSANEEGDEIVFASSQHDPQIEFAPVILNGPTFGVTITARAQSRISFKLYWRSEGENFDEGRCFAFIADEHPISRTWWHSGKIGKRIYLRVDPCEGTGNVSFKLNFLGDLDVETMRAMLVVGTEPNIWNRLWGITRKLFRR